MGIETLHDTALRLVGRTSSSPPTAATATATTVPSSSSTSTRSCIRGVVAGGGEIPLIDAHQNGRSCASGGVHPHFIDANNKSPPSPSSSSVRLRLPQLPQLPLLPPSERQQQQQQQQRRHRFGGGRCNSNDTNDAVATGKMESKQTSTRTRTTKNMMASPAGPDEERWRRHGGAHRLQLLEEDRSRGGQDFPLTFDCSVQRYFQVAHWVSKARVHCVVCAPCTPSWCFSDERS
jgi:hypothetical protein